MATTTESLNYMFGTDMTTAEYPVGSYDVIWMLVTGFIMSFILACGLGANDVANSFATSVGAKVLTLKWACILASIFETAGAVLLGAKVSDTIRKGIFDVGMYEGQEEVLMLGQVAALGGACIWMLLATWLKMPVSGTHSIVGAMLGFHLVVFQFDGINWKQFGFIVASWFLSPVLSGFMSSVIFVIYRKVVLSKEKPLEPGLRVLPIFYGLVLLINGFSIFLDGPEMLHFHKIPLWGAFILSFGIGGITALIVYFFLVPMWRTKLQDLADRKYPECTEELKEVKPDEVKVPICDSNGSVAANGKAQMANGGPYGDNGTAHPVDEQLPMVTSASGAALVETATESKEPSNNRWKVNGAKWKRLLSNDTSADSDDLDIEAKKPDSWKSIKDHPVVSKLCTPLQILSAVFASFAHGGNDVSNAIGPLVALWSIYTSGAVSQKQATPIWILFYGGVGITVGLWLLGRRVIETVGSKLTPITPSSGFTIELGAAATVLLASNIGIPISTTHCKVGSVVAIGRVRSKATVEWKLFGNILLAWIITVPITAGLSAALMAGLRLAL